MKWMLSTISCAGLWQLAFSQHHQRIHHKHKRQELIVTDTFSQIVTQELSVTYEIEDIIVYVDDNNNPVSTTTIHRNQVGPTHTSQLSYIPSTSGAPAATTSAPKSEQTRTKSSPPPLSTTASRPAPAGGDSSNPSLEGQPPQSSSPSGSGDDSDNHGAGPATGGLGFTSGVTYTPYNADNSCKSEDEVADDLANIKSYQVIRLYGTDCNQVANVIKATNGDVSIFAGIFDINNVQNEASTIASAVNGNWKSIIAVSVGNELINSGKASVDEVTSAIGTARSALRDKGYSGPITTVDTFIAMKNNPALCKASDFCAINCHAFFDGNILPSGAGPFVLGWAKKISQAAGGKTTIVTESGWPTQGNPNQKAIPGQSEHQQAIQSLKGSFSENLILYGLYNDLWKAAGPYGAEKYWGIMGNAPSQS